MNFVLLVGGILALVLTLAHGIGGEVTNLRSLTRGDPGTGERLELYVVWHLYTWQLALSAIALFAVLGKIVPASPLLHAFIALTFTGGAIVFFALVARHGIRALLEHPQWVFLAVLGALAWWGM
jgi:hypothetical protein